MEVTTLIGNSLYTKSGVHKWLFNGVGENINVHNPYRVSLMRLWYIYVIRTSEVVIEILGNYKDGLT